MVSRIAQLLVQVDETQLRKKGHLEISYMADSDTDPEMPELIPIDVKIFCRQGRAIGS